MRRKKILYISPGPKLGGAETSLLELVVHLDRERFVPAVLCSPGGELAEACRARGVEALPFPFKPLARRSRPWVQAAHGLHVLAGTPRLARWIERNRVDLVHANGARAQVYGALAARLARVPLVWHVRDSAPMGAPGRVLRRLSSTVVVPSDAVASSIAGPRGRVVRIHNGIDVEAFGARAVEATRDARGELGVGPDDRLVVMVAQIVPWKGHDAFIRAAAVAAPSLPAARFVVVGGDLSGGHRDYLDALERLRRELALDDRVRFAGHRPDVAPIIAASEVLVLPSRREPFGRVLLEAMALAKPVIAYNEGGPAEIVVDGETGFLVPAGDVDELARRIVDVVRDPELGARLGRRGRERAREAFDARRHAAAVQDIYEQLTRD